MNTSSQNVPTSYQPRYSLLLVVCVLTLHCPSAPSIQDLILVSMNPSTEVIYMSVSLRITWPLTSRELAYLMCGSGCRWAVLGGVAPVCTCETKEGCYGNVG